MRYLASKTGVTLKTALGFVQGQSAPRGRIARFLAAKYGRLLSIRDVRQGQYDAISYVGLCVCLFRSIVTMAISVAVCKIFSAKDWCDLENRVRVRSRSLEMTPFGRSQSLFDFYSNYGDIFYRLRDITTCW